VKANQKFFLTEGQRGELVGPGAPELRPRGFKLTEPEYQSNSGYSGKYHVVELISITAVSTISEREVSGRSKVRKQRKLVKRNIGRLTEPHCIRRSVRTAGYGKVPVTVHQMVILIITLMILSRFCKRPV